MSDIPEQIDCVECGGVAHLISFLPRDEKLAPGHPLAYRCAECGERFDLIWEEDPEAS